MSPILNLSAIPLRSPNLRYRFNPSFELPSWTKLAPGQTSHPLMMACLSEARLWGVTRAGYVSFLAIFSGTASYERREQGTH